MADERTNQKSNIIDLKKGVDKAQEVLNTPVDLKKAASKTKDVLNTPVDLKKAAKKTKEVLDTPIDVKKGVKKAGEVLNTEITWGSEDTSSATDGRKLHSRKKAHPSTIDTTSRDKKSVKKPKKKLKKMDLITDAILCLIVFVGAFLLVYPTFSNWYNQQHMSRAIAAYTERTKDMTPEQYDKFRKAAQIYNTGLLDNDHRFKPNDHEHAQYEALLDVTGTGIMGSIEIPKINVNLPIYHGTEETILQIAVGHLEGTSLPVGGTGTHCVLSGHRGLPSAELFTRLDEMEQGDTFMLKVLGETLTYRVDQIKIVDPDQLENISIDPNHDYCTLVTCTPYGINTQRMLVRGHRIENIYAPDDNGTVYITAEAKHVDLVKTSLIMMWPVATILVLLDALVPVRWHSDWG